MGFEFATATRIVFGCGQVAALPDLVRGFGRRVLLVQGRRAPETGLDAMRFEVPGEPDVDLVRAGAARARESADVVVAVGGGSALDAGKAIAALAANPGDVLDYLEVVGRAQPLERAPLPFVAVPTTAGTGSEVTRNAVIGSPEHRVKASLRSAKMLARVALIDPDLTVSLPPDITASTGMDALTQLIEPYVSARANPLTDAVCREGLRRAPALLRAFHNGGDGEARESMSLAALCGGLALANAGLGVVHGFAAPLGGMYEAPHGALCAAVLPHGMRANIGALRRRAPQHPALARYAEVAAWLTGRAGASPEEGADYAAWLARELRIPPLRAWGVAAADLPDVVRRAAQASSMKANPLPLTEDELMDIVERSL